MQKMYRFQSRVRYSETDCMGKLKLESVLDYFQDCSTFHSEELGIGLEYLMNLRKVWLLSYWQIDVIRFPKMGESITIATYPYEFKGFMGCRNFFMEDASGNKIALANSVWTLFDLENNKPAKINELMAEKYSTEEKLSMEYEPRKIDISGDFEQKETIVVKTHHLDTNQHVNNGQYVKMAMEMIPKEFQIGRMRAEYKKSAVLFDEIVPYVQKKDQGYLIKLCDKSVNPFAVVEIKHKSVLQ